jgi:hypothetical protein
MQAHQVCAIVNASAFKPGWRIRAADWDTSVYLAIEIDTVDTSYAASDATCRRPVTLLRDGTLYPAHLHSAEAVLAAVLAVTREIDLHEDREFLRVQLPDGSWYAPLHPHTDAGKAAWARVAV